MVLPKSIHMTSRVIKEPLRNTFNLENGFAFYDSTMRYKVIPFAYVGSEWAKAANDSVCIATHSSVGWMHLLVQSLLSWKAAASVALFVPGLEAQAARFFLEYLQFCYPEAVKRVAFHLVYPVKRPPMETSFLHSKTYDCGEDTKVIVDDLIRSVGILIMQEREWEMPYPQNLLRNKAARACPSDWVMTLDVDMLPQPSLSRRLEHFLKEKNKENCEKCAFVVPTYEMNPPCVITSALNKVESIPKTKRDLLQLIEKGSAWRFHEGETTHNQNASKLEIWEKLPSAPTDDIIEAYVADYSLLYEPTFIARRGCPPFEERFIGYGMTGISRAYEMFLAGYEFKVLDNAFLTHWTAPYTKDRSIWKTVQTLKNQNKFDNWVLEKTVTYDSDPLKLLTKIRYGYFPRKFRVIT
ncbi:hypothetical protein J437_LFUL015026 [Ladona fulva]|uniref:Beta-1,4-glucuronyltransferase 1 n=1 Tax=Ladona fulva TaxID=123851 RepID=A0A8K0KLU7_LADFU|nr:hypothetical protein J437_LFUL015026 [Ladona fulva]